VTAMARKQAHHILVPDADSATELRPYLAGDSEFVTWIATRRTEAQRQVDDLTKEIEALETDASRIRADADTAIARLEVDIQARLARRDEQLDILVRANAALDIQTPPNRPAPRLTERPADAQALDTTGER